MQHTRKPTPVTPPVPFAKERALDEERRTVPTKDHHLTAWGRGTSAQAQLARPEKEAAAIDAIAEPPCPTMIPRGAGSSYGDAALNEGGGIVSFERLDRLIAYDPDAGTVTCEAGVELGELLDRVLQDGLFPPVLPGTRHVTVGGAIASDVHGKNHEHAGAFARCVNAFRLATPSGEVLTCSRRRNPGVFWATVGGMGLTGSILTATLDLVEVESAYVLRERHRTADLEETFDQLVQLGHEASYTMAWLDAASTADPLGRGVVTAGRHASKTEVTPVTEAPLDLPERSGPDVPFTMPFSLVNRATVPLFNSLYHRTGPDGERDLVDVDRFFFPLDAIGDFHRLYGPSGLLQYQALLPMDHARGGIRRLLERIQASKVPAGLTVLKALGPGDEGLISFPERGFTLSVDVPASDRARALFSELDEICLEHEGRVYLAKDATLDRATFDAMYPAADRFRAIQRQLDPEGQLSSSLGRRLGLADGTGGAPA